MMTIYFFYSNTSYEYLLFVLSLLNTHSSRTNCDRPPSRHGVCGDIWSVWTSRTHRLNICIKYTDEL